VYRSRLTGRDPGVEVPYVLAALILGGGLLVLGLRPRYRRDIEAARGRLAALDRETVDLVSGSVDYIDVGHGPCVLVSHGIFHGCDGGQRAARDVVFGHRIVAPSRFGYLGSDMPLNASGAEQADAFTALLDHLGIDKVHIMGISAGTSAAIQMALRHPDRLNSVVISSGNWPGSPTADAPPSWAKMLYNDQAMWLLNQVAPQMVAGLMGVPKGFPEDDEQAAYVDEMVSSIFPLKPRYEGAVFDAYSSNPEINDYPLEHIDVPFLIIHSKDDPLASHEAAEEAAERIPRARLISLESGGHLALGQTENTRLALGEFLQDYE